jgi:hypothetical protein
MVLAVSDTGANRNDNIENAAKVIGRSVLRRAIFDAIYTGKKSVKSASWLAKKLRKPEKHILTEAKKLVDAEIVEADKESGRKAYRKRSFFHLHKKKILALVDNPKKLRSFPTKVRPATNVKLPSVLRIEVGTRAKATIVTIDDIESFAKVKKVPSAVEVKMAEGRFKEGVKRILGELGRFQDWGGEINDLYSSRVRIGGRRRTVAFAFKGPGKRGVLTPGKMGKNGDQIQRLIRSPAEVFILQYWSQVGDAVHEQLEQLARGKAAVENRKIWYGVFDGQDSARLIKAYPSAFKN